MPLVVEESGKDNVVPVRLLIRERLGFLNADCVIGNGLLNADCAIGNGQGNASRPKQRKKVLNADCVIGNGQGNASPLKQQKKGKHD